MAAAKQLPQRAFYRVVPAPGRPGSVVVAVSDGKWPQDVLEKWRTAVHADAVTPRAFRMEREAEPKWWRYFLTPGEGYSLAQFVKGRGYTTIIKKMGEDVERAMIMQMHKGGVEGLAAMIEGKPLPTLYFLHAPGCEACEMLKPEVAVWWRVNKHRVRVVPIDLTRAEWKAKSWEPNMTPSLVVRWPDGKLSKWLEGYEPGAFLAWVEQALR